jgi:hypothetical protein
MHWDNVDVNKLKDTVWHGVAKLLNPTEIQYNELLSDPPEVFDEVEETYIDDEGYEDTRIISVKREYPPVEEPSLHFGLLTPQDVTDITLLFSQAKSTVKKAPAAPKVEAVALLDPKRSHAINISLGQLRMDFTDLVINVMSMNDKMPIDKVAVLVALLPTADEIKLMRGFKGDMTLLGSAEAFFMAILTAEDTYRRLTGQPAAANTDITLFEKCVRATIFMRDFGEWSRTLTDQLDTATNALVSLRDSPTTKLLLLTTLSVGNIINCEHNMRSFAYGFHLSDLVKISGVKANLDAVTALEKKHLPVDPEAEEEAEAEAGDDEADGVKEPASPAPVDTRELDIDFIDYPLPKQPNLAHFITKIIMRRDPHLCPLLGDVADAYSIAAKIEQNSVTGDVNSLSGSMRKVSTLYAQIMSDADKVVPFCTKFGDTVDDKRVLTPTGETDTVEDHFELSIARSFFSSFNKLDAFNAYAALRVESIVSASTAAQALAVELSEFLHEPDAKTAWELLFTQWGGFLHLISSSYADIISEKTRRESMRKRKHAMAEMKRKKNEMLQLSRVLSSRSSRAEDQ